jgi:hypothetical protein
MPNIGQELLNVPFPEMVEQLGMSIAKAQFSLDMNSVKIAQIMSGSDWIDTGPDGKPVHQAGMKVNFGGRQLSLLELGFTPTFYQFVDTIIEVKISVSMTSSTEEKHSNTDVDMSTKVKAGWGSVSANMHIATVSASYAARTGYSAEGASLIRTKLVPLPPPAVLQERIRNLMEEQKRKEIAFDPGVLSFALGAETTAKTVTTDVAVTSKSASPDVLDFAADSTDSTNSKKFTVKPKSGATAGVVVVSVVGEGGKKGTLNVLLTSAAS